MNYSGLSIPLHKNSYFPRIEHEQDAGERKKRLRPRVAGSRKHQLFFVDRDQRDGRDLDYHPTL